MTQQACIISNLTLDFPQQKIFDNISFQLPLNSFSGLVGKNGQGKSLLMSILHQQKKIGFTYSGQILWQYPHKHLTQLQRIEESTIAQALDIYELYFCFERIKQGIASFADYDQVENLWHLPAH